MSDYRHLHLPVLEPTIPYLVIVWNGLLFYLLRKLLLRLFPLKLHLFIQELISTIELCADCSELGNLARQEIERFKCKFIFLTIFYAF